MRLAADRSRGALRTVLPNLRVRPCRSANAGGALADAMAQGGAAASFLTRRRRLSNAVKLGCAAQPILVSARSAKTRPFREERSGPGGRPGRTADRRIMPIRSLA